MFDEYGSTVEGMVSCAADLAADACDATSEVRSDAQISIPAIPLYEQHVIAESTYNSADKTTSKVPVMTGIVAYRWANMGNPKWSWKGPSKCLDPSNIYSITKVNAESNPDAAATRCCDDMMGCKSRSVSSLLYPTFAAAKTDCESLGMHLCSKDELAQINPLTFRPRCA